MFKAQVKVLVNVLNSDLFTFWGIITKKGYLITLLSLKKTKIYVKVVIYYYLRSNLHIV